MSKLRDWREKAGLTQEQAGDQVGVSAVAWGRYERGRFPEPPVMQKIIDATDSSVTPNDFFAVAPHFHPSTNDAAPRDELCVQRGEAKKPSGPRHAEQGRRNPRAVGAGAG